LILEESIHSLLFTVLHSIPQLNLYSLAEKLVSKDWDEIGKEIGSNAVGNDQTDLALHTAED